jgi:hypothetical protein
MKFIKIKSNKLDNNFQMIFYLVLINKNIERNIIFLGLINFNNKKYMKYL